MMTLSEALAAYRICAKAEARSPRTIEWITSSVRRFMEFLGGDPDIESITANDFRRFIIALQETHKYRKHPFTRPQEGQAQSRRPYCDLRGLCDAWRPVLAANACAHGHSRHTGCLGGYASAGLLFCGPDRCPGKIEVCYNTCWDEDADRSLPRCTQSWTSPTNCGSALR